MLAAYIKEVFSEDTQVKKVDMRDKLPLMLLNEYDFFQATIAGYPCVLLHYKGQYLSVKRLEKHFAMIQNVIVDTSHHIVLWLDVITKAQRTKLIAGHVPFIVPLQQIYLPFAYMSLSERYAAVKEPAERFTVATQCVYIWLFYETQRHIRIHEVSTALQLAPITVSRAFRDLAQRELVETFGKETRKAFRRIERAAYWEKGNSAMETPVKQVFYAEANANLNVPSYTAGENALTQYSMLGNPDHDTYAIYKKDINALSIPIKKSLDELEDDIWTRIEVWKYDPGLFTSIEIDNAAIYDEVDQCSLFASMRDTDDVRISIALDEMMEGVLHDERD